MAKIEVRFWAPICCAFVLGFLLCAALNMDPVRRNAVASTTSILHDEAALPASAQTTEAAPSSSAAEPASNFLTLARNLGVDKVVAHSYHHAYAKYLEPIRNKKLTFLEIGLGCGMADPRNPTVGAGLSMKLWTRFLPNTDQWMFEFNRVCAEQLARPALGDHLIVGDQSSVADLNAAIKKIGAFDIVIDDGGHSMDQQIISLQVLFPAVRPGGLYFVEDLETSFLPQYGGSDTGSNRGLFASPTTLQYLSNLVRGLTDKRAVRNDPSALQMLEFIHSIDCFKEICVLTRNSRRI